MAACPMPADYSWHECKDFQVPENSVWFGRDDDGSDIFCGKAWCDGQEVPAKIIPNRRECRVSCDDGEKLVPHCRKVLICKRSGGNDGCIRRDECRRGHHHHHGHHNHDHGHHHHEHRHHHGRHHHRHSDDCCSSGSENEDENNTVTKTSSSSKNECRMFVRSVRCSSNSTTTTVKKNKKKRRQASKSRRECWDEQRTRVVPRVTYEPRVRYEPKVTMERKVRYDTETYTTRVCGDRSCCEPCEDRCESYEDRCESYEDCCEPCESTVEACRRERRCEEALICERPTTTGCRVEKEERCIRPDRCDSPQRSPRGRCW